MIMPPLKALALSDSHKQYNQGQQGQNNDQSDDSQDSPRTPEEEERDNPEGYVDDSGKHIPKYFYGDR